MTPIDREPLEKDLDQDAELDAEPGAESEAVEAISEEDANAAARAASIAAAARIAEEIDRSAAEAERAAAAEAAAEAAAARAAPAGAAPGATAVTAGPGGLKEALAARQRATKLRTGRQQLEAGQPNSALGWLLELIRDHPDTPEGQEATTLVLELAARWEREGKMRLAIDLYQRLEALS